jgi:hypothetical protein
MKMFVANVSDQIFAFCYRLPEVEKLRGPINIPPRAQIMLPDKDMTQQQVDAVIKQHAVYGMVRSTEVGGGAIRRARHNLCYSIDAPVPAIRMEGLFRDNHDVLVKEGQVTRQQTAVASSIALDEEVDKRTRNTEMEGVAQEPKNFVVDVVEDERRDVSDSDRLAEGYRVERAAPFAPIIKSGRRRAK